MMKIFTSTRKINPLTDAFKSYVGVYLSRISRENNALRKQRMAVYANDWVGININLYGIYEGHDLSVIFEFLAPLHTDFNTGLALDVGANVGNHAIFFDKYFRRVIAFEPNPSTYDLLKFNSRYSKSVTAIDFGLGDVSGEFDLWEDAENFGGSKIKKDAYSESVKVNVKRLDGCEFDLGGLELIKIDVEGFEANVLRGAKDAIKRYQPIILFEQNETEFNSGEPETIGLMREMGYSFCWIKQKKVAKTWLGRRFQTLLELLGNGHVEDEILSASELPAATYSMIVGVPERLKKTLGLQVDY